MAASREPFNVTQRPTHVAVAAQQHSPWHSPVPYLFGGFAAMLGLIAFALLILACSYWKLSGFLEGSGDGTTSQEPDLENGEGIKDDSKNQKALPAVFEEKVLVIMAGHVKPTYLATPTSTRSSSSGDHDDKSKEKSDDDLHKSVEMADQTVKQGGAGGGDHVLSDDRNIDTHDPSDQTH